MKVVAALLRSAIPLLILMMLTVWLAIPMLLKVLCYAGMIGALFALKAVTPRDIRMLWQALLRKPQAGDEPRRPEDPSPRTVTGMAREPGPLT